METLFESWIQLATRAPSGDNCQPWDFSFAPGSFKVTINPERAQHFLDQNTSASWISLGCLCENLNASASFFGFKCTFEVDSAKSVTVKYHPTEKQTSSDIVDIINRRQTFRGKLDKVDFSYGQPRHQIFKWQKAPKISRNLLWKWSWIETVLWLKTPLMQDFTKWVNAKNDSSGYGVSLQSLQVSLMDRISLMLFKKKPNLVKFVPSWFFQIKTYFRLKFLVEKSSGLLCLTGRFQRPQDYFYAGMEIQRMWLYLTQKNIKAQPLAIQSLFLNFTNTESIKSFLTDKQIRKLNSIKMGTYLDLKTEEELIFILRYGVSNQSLPLLPRKKIDIVF